MSNDKIKKKVYLSPEQRKNLESVSRNGHSPAKKILHARVLLMADQYHPKGGKTDMQISEALGMHVNTVGRIRRSFVFEGEESALERKKREFPPVRACVGWGKRGAFGGLMLFPATERKSSVDTQPLG